MKLHEVPMNSRTGHTQFSKPLRETEVDLVV